MCLVASVHDVFLRRIHLHLYVSHDAFGPDDWHCHPRHEYWLDLVRKQYMRRVPGGSDHRQSHPKHYLLAHGILLSVVVS